MTSLNFWTAGFLCLLATVSAENRAKRFIVEGNGNTVDNNIVTDNENTYASSNSSTSGGSTGTSSGSSTGATSGGNPAWVASCDYNGHHHKPGDVFTATDGCNKCTCSPLGAACTTHSCTGKREIQNRAKRFIVEGNGNTVDNNVVTDNENTYASSNSSTSGRSTSTSSGKRGIQKRFIVTGDGNEVDGNTVSHNENTYANDSSSGGATGGSSSTGTSGGSSAGSSGWTASCDYNGHHHKPGDVFTATDGCNTCTCSPLGAACTTHSCTGKREIQKRFIVTGDGNEVDGNTVSHNENTYANDSSSGGATGGSSSTGTSGGSSAGSSGWTASCDYNGHHHKPGDVFTATDGCNTCTCSPLGAACTTHSCTGKREIHHVQKKFIVDGDKNHVNGNTITDNENTYASGSNSTVGSTSGTSGGGNSSLCDYNGQHHKPGDVFPSKDGCNKCTCTPLGAACYTNPCSGKRETNHVQKRFIVEGNNNHVDGNTITDNENTFASGSGSTSGTSSGTSSGGVGSLCDYNGQHHKPGDVFPSKDGCNKCTCTPLGAACYTNPCSGKRDTGQFARRFIVEGSNNHVDNNMIVFNDNHYGTGGGNKGGSSSGSVTSGVATAARTTASPSGSQGKYTCTFHGKTYHQQQVFPALDGCNSCMCTLIGASCTTNTCTSKATAPPQTSKTTGPPSATPPHTVCADTHPDPNHCKQPRICLSLQNKQTYCRKTCGVCGSGWV